jgi:hypothetical protein
VLSGHARIGLARATLPVVGGIAIAAVTVAMGAGRLARDASFAKATTVAQALPAANLGDGAAAEINVPPLIIEVQQPARGRSAWARLAPSPIEVISSFQARDIPPGAEARAVLLTGATNGLIKARLAEPVMVDGVSVLESGILLLGSGRSTEERLYARFHTAIYKNGAHFKIAAEAYDASDSILGLKGSRVGDATLKLAASSGLHFLSGMAAGLEAPSTDDLGRARRPTAQDAALTGVSRAASEQAQSYMEDVKQRQPIIEVKAGTAFILTFEAEEK